MDKLLCNHESKYLKRCAGVIYIDGKLYTVDYWKRPPTIESKTYSDFEHCVRKSEKMVISPHIEKVWAGPEEEKKNLLGYKLVWHF